MSNNPQWKMFQPPESHSSPLHDILDLPNNMQAKQAYRNGTYSGEYPSTGRDNRNYSNGLKSGSDNRFTIGTFNMDSSCPMGDSSYSSSTNNSSQYDSMTHPPIRETGIIEKLLHSYGFIQCCERQARLFFHFSQFSGNTEHLKIGDPVEFEMTYDKRTGKPIASTVTKIAPEVVLSEARVTGTVTTEVKGEGSGDNTGRISYENRGECFFLPYTKDDVEGNVVLHTGDAVSFQIATNQRGTLGACHVRFENPQSPVKYHGVVCSLKESFGFIERADVVKEIFFHYSEAKTKEELVLGDDVEFIIQTRNGKEVACNITKLPCGSVVFEDVCPETMRGQVLKPLERGGAVRVPQTDPLPGRIRYRALDHSEVEVPFGDKDQYGEFTLRHGDWVQFQVATDRRDQLKRATNISLLDESFNVSGERREQGVVNSLRPLDGYGFIRCVEREQFMMFRFTEVLRLGRELSVGDEVEFTVEPVSTFNMNNRQSAIRIKHLPAGSVKFVTLVERGVHGVVSKEAVPAPPDTSPVRVAATQESGLITCQMNQVKKSIPYNVKKRDSRPLRVGDKVTFDVYQVKRTKGLVAMLVQLQQNGIITNGCREIVRETNRDVGREIVRDVARDHSRDVTRDAARDVPREITRDMGREINRDVARDIPRDIGRESTRDVGREIIRDSAREIPRDTSRETTRDSGRDMLLKKFICQASLRESRRDGCREMSRDNGRESTQDVGREIVRESGRETAGREMTREIVREIVREPARESTRDRRDIVLESARDPARAVQQGFIAALKDGFGFIETADHNKEVFFHFSIFEGNPDHLELGSEVEYALGRSSGGGGCASAEFVRTLARGTVPLARALEPAVQGTVTRTLRALNPDQTHYSGLIQVEGGVSYEYGIMGLACKREILQVGDPVTFQVDTERRATNIVPVRKKRRAVVDAIKGGFGFLSLEMEETRRLFFHMSEVRGAATELQPGDTVEFVMLTNPRNGKSSACNVVKIPRTRPTERPERLLARLRTASLDEAGGPRVVVTRTPRGPDGTRGFRPRRPLSEVLGE